MSVGTIDANLQRFGAKSRYYNVAKLPEKKEKKTLKSESAASNFFASPVSSLLGSKVAEDVDAVSLTGVCWPSIKSSYELRQLIGVGTTSVIHLANCLPRKEFCAVKVVGVKRYSSNIETLLKEIQAMKSFNSDFVINYHVAFLEGETLYLVLPYMEHGSLRQLIDRKMKFVDCSEGVFNEATIATILASVLCGVDYLHSNGYVHRDLRAEKILVGKDGTVKIADFVIQTVRAQHGSFVGRPFWLAPEIIQSQTRVYTPAADLWSLGITAIEIATGAPPNHKLCTMKALMLTLLNDPPTLETAADFKNQYKMYGREFREFIAACTKKDPEERPPVLNLCSHPFFQKSRDKAYLEKALAQIPMDIGSKFERAPEKLPQEESPRKKWILIPEEEHTTDVLNQAPRQKSTSIKTASSRLKTTSKDVRQTNLSVHEIVLTTRALHLDSPMVLKTGIHEKRDLLNISFNYDTHYNSPQKIALSLACQGLIDSRDIDPVATNLKKLVNTSYSSSITFRLNSGVAKNEAVCQWRLIGFASLEIIQSTARFEESEDKISSSIQ